MSTPSPRTCPCTTAITPFRRTRPRFFVLSAAYSDFRAEIGRGRASLVRERVDRMAVSAISQSDVRLGIRVMGQRCALQVRCGGRVGPVGRARRLGAISKRDPPRAAWMGCSSRKRGPRINSATGTWTARRQCRSRFHQAAKTSKNIYIRKIAGCIVRSGLNKLDKWQGEEFV